MDASTSFTSSTGCSPLSRSYEHASSPRRGRTAENWVGTQSRQVLRLPPACWSRSRPREARLRKGGAHVDAQLELARQVGMGGPEQPPPRSAEAQLRGSCRIATLSPPTTSTMSWPRIRSAAGCRVACRHGHGPRLQSVAGSALSNVSRARPWKTRARTGARRLVWPRAAGWA